MGNMKLWDSVQKTEPKYTKPFNRAGGFNGTAINATYVAKCATAMFGPIGIGWGLEIVDEAYVEGAPIMIGDREVCKEVIHKLRVKLWYKLGEQRGEVTQFGLTTFVGKNKYGTYTDEEAPKKSLTDAMTKCLSLLGFCSDIHLGLYDDNKYVNDLKKEAAKASVKKISDYQARYLAKAVVDTGSDMNKFLGFFGIEEMEEMKDSDYEKAVNMLMQKAKDKEKKP